MQSQFPAPPFLTSSVFMKPERRWKISPNWPNFFFLFFFCLCRSGSCRISSKSVLRVAPGQEAPPTARSRSGSRTCRSQTRSTGTITTSATILGLCERGCRLFTLPRPLKTCVTCEQKLRLQSSAVVSSGSDLGSAAGLLLLTASCFQTCIFMSLWVHQSIEFLHTRRWISGFHVPFFYFSTTHTLPASLDWPRRFQMYRPPLIDTTMTFW